MAPSVPMLGCHWCAALRAAGDLRMSQFSQPRAWGMAVPLAQRSVYARVYVSVDCVCVYVWFFESQSLCVCGCVCVCVPVSVWMCVHAHECESVCECMCEGVGAGVAGVCVLGAGCTGPLVGEGPALQAAGFL